MHLSTRHLESEVLKKPVSGCYCGLSSLWITLVGGVGFGRITCRKKKRKKREETVGPTIPAIAITAGWLRRGVGSKRAAGIGQHHEQKQ